MPKQGGEKNLHDTPLRAKKRKVSTENRTNGPPNETALAARLVKEWHFSDTDLARKFANNGIAEALFALEDDKDFKISEDDPLLIISVDVEDANSRDYFRHGNYVVASHYRLLYRRVTLHRPML